MEREREGVGKGEGRGQIERVDEAKRETVDLILSRSMGRQRDREKGER